MFYRLIRKMLFQLDPEYSHTIALKALQYAYRCGLLSRLFHTASNPRELLGLTFPNPVGLAAGLDKNAEYVDALAALGFGFIEIGTVTPRPQWGNPRPRLFRLTNHNDLINRMGFNNKVVDYVSQKLEKMNYRGILGINIGKNKETPLDRAIDDYLIGFRTLAKFASYMTINISSPNTPGLRELQQADLLSALLNELKQEQKKFAQLNQKYIPLIVKISPDLTLSALHELADVLLQQQIDGIIATNTTIEREGVEDSPHCNEAGGLSGQPLQSRSTFIIRELHTMLKNKIPIIASGGVMDKTSAQEKLKAGASLIQIYTGFIYSGPQLITLLQQ